MGVILNVMVGNPDSGVNTCVSEFGNSVYGELGPYRNYLTTFAEVRCSVLKIDQLSVRFLLPPPCVYFQFKTVLVFSNLNNGGHKGAFASRFLTGFSR